MKIPRKITPDSLKDSIVQIRFEPKSPPELVLGNFYNLFKDSLKFISGDITEHLNDKKVVIGQAIGGYFVDLDDKVKINVSSDNITFNSLSDYIGWDNYFDIINRIIKVIIENDFIEKVNRIGVRYISQYDELSVFDNINLDLSFSLNKNLSSSQFRTEFVSDKFKVILTLLNLIPTPENSKVVSVIDIDVIKVFDESERLNGDDYISKFIDQAHNKQKNIFFSLLKDDFLKSLNPEY